MSAIRGVQHSEIEAQELKELDYQGERLESEGSESYKNDEKYGNQDEIDDDDKSEDQPSEDVSDEEDNDIFLSENHYQQVNKNNLLGVVTYIKWMRKYQYYFALDMHRGRLLLYKKSQQKKPSTYYSLIKGRFEDDSEYQVQDGDDIIRIRNKKGRKFRLELYQNKDPKKIRELIQLCFAVSIQKPNKGFYATLGRSIMSVFNHPFNVFSGIIVDMKKSNADESKKQKAKNDKQNMNKIKASTALGSLFFSQSELLKEILGSISGFILNPFNSKALSESFSGGNLIQFSRNNQKLHRISKISKYFYFNQTKLPYSVQSQYVFKQFILYQKAHFVIGLVFKPISGTIDLIGKSTEYKKDHIIHQNVFKVYKISKNKKKNNKKSKKEEQERSKREAALEIHEKFMEKVYENEDEILYLNKNNILGITKKDIVQLSSLAKGLNLEDVDHTLKVDFQYEQQKVKMNKLLDYYIKNKKEKSEEYEEDMCEFIVLQPIIDKSVRSEKILKGIDDDEKHSIMTSPNNHEEFYFDGDIEEIGDEVGDERIGHCVNKKIPFTTKYHQVDKKETFNTIMPEFLVRDSPFKNGTAKGYFEDETRKLMASPSSFANNTENEKKYEKNIDEGQLKIPFSSKVFLDPQKQYNDTDDEMQFHSFTNNQGNDLTSIDPSNDKQLSNRNTDSKNNSDQKKTIYSNEKDAVVEQIKIDENPEVLKQQESSIANNDSSPKAEEDEKEESDGEDEEEEEEEQGIAKAQDKNVYFSGNKADLAKLIEGFNILTQKDENRVTDSHNNGGKQCTDKEVINTTRSVGKYIIKEIGRKIISGDFNLTQVSFPIKAMIPKSALQTALNGTCLFPIYMGIASQTTDLVERFKNLIVATFANFPVANTFLKPLNPILGETFQGSYIDGTKLFGEQVSHHPPVSYFLAEGPNKSYKYYGYYLYEAKAGWNSLTLRNKGKRSFIFKDGQKVDYNFGYEYYSGTFMGTMKHETLGQIEFSDPVNKIEAVIVTGKVKKKPTDYIQGDIKVNGKTVSTCYGSYLGFIEFDGKRYWDHRHVLPLKMNIINSSLQSDHQKRTDRKYLAASQLKKAQEEKERLEGIQRNDAKLRKKHLEKTQKAQKAATKEKNKKK